MIKHRVKRGEHLSQLAHDYGFLKWEAIWLAPENATLRKRRKDPNILAPGDELFIPDKTKKKCKVQTNQRHRFRVKTPHLRLRLDIDDFLQNLSKRPKTVKLWFGSWEKDASIDGDGKIDEEIPPHAKEISFELNGLAFTVLVGDLDPQDSQSGRLHRLLNLGYLDPEEVARPDAAVIEAAVMSFQRAVGLKPDGQCTGETLGKLVELHGS